jgi:hypothetical protein
MTRRVVLGLDADVVGVHPDGIELRGPIRLGPGLPITLIRVATGLRQASEQPAVVWTWRLVATGSQRPAFRGVCRWLPIAGCEQEGKHPDSSAPGEIGPSPGLASPLNRK